MLLNHNLSCAFRSDEDMESHESQVKLRRVETVRETPQSTMSLTKVLMYKHYYNIMHYRKMHLLK